MKNKMLQRILIIVIILMMFCTSSSYAAYTFKQGTNTITADEYRNGVEFRVEATGVYAISVLPVIEDYEWQYTIVNNKTGANISLAVAQDGFDSKGEPIYKLYSDDIPYVLLIKGETYKLQAYNGKNKNKLVTGNSRENYVTINISGPTTTESGKYYEGSEKRINDSIEEDNFSLWYKDPNPKSQQSGVDLVDPGKKFEILGGEKKADLVQQLLTSFLVDIVGDGIMFLIGVVAGEPITIDKIIFNEYGRTRLAFFANDLKKDDGTPDPDKENPLLSTTGILPKYNESDGSLIDEGTLNKFFNRFTMIAIVVYLVMLLYMGARIVLSSTGKDMAKYKKLFVDWVAGVMILFLFPYVMRYTIKINDAVVGYIGTLRNGIVQIEEAEIIDYPGGLAFPFSYVGTDSSASLDYMSQMRQSALDTGRIVYALCWLLMIKELVGFLLTYIKRLLMTLFLIVIFPLVTISYAIDKIGDGTSQAFNHWVKEFILNVFLQTFHALNYVVVMGIIFAIGRSTGQTNFILIILGLTYLAQGDKIIRSLFSQMKGGGGGTVKDVAESFFATTGAIHMLKSSAATISNGVKNIKNLSDRRLEMSNKSSKIAERKANDKWDHWNLSSMRGPTNALTTEQIDNGISNAANIVTDKRSTVERIQSSVGYLRQASMAGGETQARYEAQMAKLQQEDPDKYQELMDIMDQSDAVDGMQNIEHMTEAELNAHLNVLVNNRVKKTDIKNRLKKRNIIMLGNELEKNGITKKRQDELQKTLKARELTEAQQSDLQKVRSSICTKEDAERLAKIKALDERAKAIHENSSNRKQNLERNIEGIERKLQNSRMSQKERKDYEQRLEKLKEQVSNIDPEGKPTFEERKELFEISEKKKAIEAKLTNKKLTTKVLEKTGYDKNAQVAKYRAAAQMASGAMPSEEQIELAEAQAVLDGSDSGEYTLDEIWQASKTVKKAKKRAKKDKGIQKILELSQNDSTTAKPDGFEEQVAALVVKNKNLISGNSGTVAAEVNEAKEVLKENAKEGGVYQYILDDSGLGVKEDKFGNLEDIINIHEEGSVKEVANTISTEVKEKRKENKKVVGEVLTDADSIRTMKNELFSERLNFTRDVVKTATTPILKVTTGMAATGMYAGAAGDYSTTKAMAAGTLGSTAADATKNAVVDSATKRVDKFADKVSGVKDSVQKGELNFKKFASVMMYDDDNNQGVETRNMQIEQSHTASAQMTRQEKQILQEIEQKKQEIDRIEARRERLKQSINRANNANRTNNGENNNEETNNS